MREHKKPDHDTLRGWLSLAAAGALETEEQAEVDRHLGACEECAAEFERWRMLASGLKRLPTPQPSAALVERVRASIVAASATQAEKRWNQGVLIFLVLFSWTLTLAGWPIVRLATHGVSSWLEVGFTKAWMDLIGYTALGWLTAGVAAMLLTWQKRRERRLA
jgi:anti-sigma factor RsiW